MARLLRLLDRATKEAKKNERLLKQRTQLIELAEEAIGQASADNWEIGADLRKKFNEIMGIEEPGSDPDEPTDEE